MKNYIKLIVLLILFPLIAQAGGFNGSGLYNRYYNWTNDANAGIDITATRFDTEDNGFASGLSQCITKDGQQVVTGNIPFSGFKLLNIGDATLPKDAVNSETIQGGNLIYGGTSSGTNTITAGTTPSFSSYTIGQVIRILAGSNNTGAVTFNINGIGAVAGDRQSVGGLVAAVSGDIVAGQFYDLFYDGTQIQFKGSTLDASIASTYAPLASPTFTGTPSLPTGTTAITQGANDSSTKLATTAFVKTVPTIQKFLSGTGTYTTPSGVVYIEVRMIGGGGGGAGGGTTQPAGSTGGNTTFGTSLLVANGGGGAPGASGGVGGTASLGSGPIGIALQGGNGDSGGANSSATPFSKGGYGASSPFGGSGSGGIAAVGGAAIANTGAGGGGGSGGNASLINGGGGGSMGGYIDAIITSPLSTYSYAVGAGGIAGVAGTSGSGGGIGGAGIIIIIEHYIG